MFQVRISPLAVVLSSFALLLFHAPSAFAINYTVTYNQNNDQYQTGETSGTVPAQVDIAAGGTLTASSNTGNLARQGFVFNGWNTAANGSGTQLAAGSGTLLINGNTTLFAQWSIPQSARLIGQTGSLVTTSNPNAVTNGSKCTSGNIRGITSDGTYYYFRPSSDGAYICKITSTGVVVAAMNFGTNLSSKPIEAMALVISNGCIFIRSSGLVDAPINCLSISDLGFSTPNMPAGKGVLAGQGWGTGNLISFPDGRIGAVSQPNQTLTTGTGANQCPATLFCKILRLYTVSGSGTAVQLGFSEDIVLADNANNWPTDDHGIATDGTYLYQINFDSGYKVYALRSGAPSYLVFNAVNGSGCAATSPAYCPINTPNTGLSMSNATYIGRNHNDGRYFIGDFNASKFWLSSAAVPPAGPGSLSPATISTASVVGSIYKGVSKSLTVTSNTSGLVNFYIDGKKIPNCQRIPTTGSAPTFTAVCNWKPAVTANHSVIARIIPANGQLIPTYSTAAQFWVLKRTTLR